MRWCSEVLWTCKPWRTVVLLLVLLVPRPALVYAAVSGSTRCYDDSGKPARCIPEFENAAFNVKVEATNTCGEYEQILFCLQSGGTGNKSCEYCRDDVRHLAHPSDYLTDLNNYENQTWWQSETMYEGIQYPNQVNLTLHLGKAFDITYVRLVFYSPKPESFAIYKRTSEDGPWIPYQYYSATCRDTYGLTDDSYVSRREESRAICTSEFSDISPLTGGNVAFSTLEGRPSAKNFDNSPELQEWVTATDIRITLDRLNTFGDEVFGDPQVLRSYFYAITEFAVGARCKCNGHASECVTSSALDGSSRRVCRCEHNTAGPDCNECLPFYNDVPWARSAATNVHECKPCNCNGFSNRCFFDQELYARTGHGGHCLDCTGNRDGANCERCKDNFFQREDGFCIACSCNEIGSRNLQCNSEGRCQCKPGVTGDKCDRCEANYYDFGPSGCKLCGCSEEGSFANTPRCDPTSGICYCKTHVEGKRCDKCKPSYFNLDLENEYGCTPCFCYGHSSVCQSAPGYSQVVVESIFARGNERWTAQEANGRSISMNYNGLTQSVGASAPARDPVYFVAPDRFLGDMRASYNRDLQFKLRIGETAPSASVEDVVLEGAGIKITQTIFGQRNKLPSTNNYDYKFRLHEDSTYGWQPRLSAREFMSVLSNLTALKIRGTYTPEGTGFLDDVKLHTARREAAGRPANWIEMCTCPEGYVGQFCESCAPGFRHEPAHGGRFARCVPCNCNGHADICDADTGRCICQDNTAGENCERCARGFYGNALNGTTSDCQPCPCPNQGACVELMDETVVCLECPKGYGGPRCDICSDGYFGEPEGLFGRVEECKPCDCNTNVDPNGIGNCNRTSGECLKCIYNTGGSHCDQCLPGYFGDALALPKGDCKLCQCYSAGTQQIAESGPLDCDQLTGQCKCKPFVTGTNCDTCQDGYFNIISGEGCQACNCDFIGSVDGSCDIRTGQCKCRSGITGLRCDVCEAYQYGFSSNGCKRCECDPIGSMELQCDPFGQCPCYENVQGMRCDQCKENKHDRQRGCIDCPPCYDLVQDAVNDHRRKLTKLIEMLGNITETPTVIDDVDFERKLNEVQERVDQLWNDAKQGSGGGDKSLLQRVEELRGRLQGVAEMHQQVEKLAEKSKDLTGQGERNVTEAEDIIERAQEALQNALDFLQTDGVNALNEAIRRSEQFGQQSEQMSEIARQARQLAQEQEEEAEAIQEIAQAAVNTSQQAYEVAKNAINEQKNTSDELRTLRHELETATDKLDRTKIIATEARDRAVKVHQEALGIYRDVYGLNVPEIDSRKLRSDAEEAAERARQIKAEAEAILAEHGELLSELAEQSADVEKLLKKGVEQQQIADELLADADAANADAEEAVRLGDKTLAEAQNTLLTLQGFDKEVQKSKYRAQEALDKIDDISALIEEAEVKAADARNALAGAEQDAQIAKNEAQEAQTQYAEKASQDADEIRQGADETKKLAEQLRDEADTLASRVAVTESRLKELEDQASTDEALTNEAKQKVGQAKSNAGEATKKVEKALADVDDIMRELQDVTDIDEENLNDLEKKLAEAERDFQNANLEQRMTELMAIKNQQVQWIKDYTEEVERLRKEVNNIDDIRMSLPDGCWKRVKLEP